MANSGALPRGSQRKTHPRAPQIAREFHEAYERLAPLYGWKPQAEASVPWDDVPVSNALLMTATVTELLERGVIR